MRTKLKHGLLRLFLAISPTFLLSIWPGVVVADPSGPEETPADLLYSDLKIGPFYVRPTFRVSELGYHSNPFNAVAEESDFGVHAAPGLRLGLPFGDNAFTISQSFGYQYFRDRDDRRTWSSTTDIGLDAIVGGALRLDVNELLRRTRDSYDEGLLARPLRLENELRVALESDREAGVYFEGRFRHLAVRFDDQELLDGESVKERFDRTALTGSLDLFLDFLAPARVILGARYEEQRLELPTGDGRGWFAYGGLRFEPHSSLRGDVRLGYRKMELGAAAVSELEGFGGDVNLVLELGGATELRVGGQRGNVYTSLSSVLLAVKSSVSAALKVPLGDRLAVELGSFFSEVTYPTGLDASEFDGSYHYRRLGADVLIPFGDDIWIDLGAGNRRLSGSDSISYEGYAVTMGMRYGI